MINNAYGQGIKKKFLEDPVGRAFFRSDGGGDCVNEGGGATEEPSFSSGGGGAGAIGGTETLPSQAGHWIVWPANSAGMSRR